MIDFLKYPNHWNDRQKEYQICHHCPNLLSILALQVWDGKNWVNVLKIRDAQDKIPIVLQSFHQHFFYFVVELKK